MKTNKLLAAVLACLSMQAAGAATVNLTGLGYVTYGDANSYSLAAANYYACGSANDTKCAYYVNGSPGLVDPFVRIVEGANGHQNNGITGMDNAFDAVNNKLYFTMTGANEPTNTFTGDKVGTWDSTLSALNTKLNLFQNAMTFFFVNNEPDSQDSQNLAVWARITLSNPDGTLAGTWDLTNDPRTAAQRLLGSPSAPGYGPPPIGGGVPNGNVALYTSEGNEPQKTDFVMSGGAVCINKISKAIVNCATATPGSFDTINHNLGANQAPYAVTVPELDAEISRLLSTDQNWGNYVMHVDLRYGCVTPQFTISGNNGNATCSDGTAVSQDNNFEQVFIGTRLAETRVPEPETLLLVGLGLFGLAAVRRSRRA